MRKFSTIGLVLKILIFTVCYFWDVGMSSSVNNPMQEEFRSRQIDPIPLRINNELSDFDDFEDLEAGVAFLMGKYDIKGASIAVARDGKLIFAKGIGYADAGAKEQVEPKHLFRIASVSKLITATTIMKMSELDLLDIDDKVFGKDGILNDSIYLDYVDPRIEKITVRHLLSHSSGWSRRYGDPMFMLPVVAMDLKVDLPVQVSDIIRFALKSRLHCDPGSRTSYFNLGYAILGEIIENISGMKYEAYVREEILSPIGIVDMKIGGSLMEDRFENEVKYYATAYIPGQHYGYLDNQAKPLAYGGNDIKTLGAAGGWIASPVEILKLVVAIDSVTDATNIISPESIKLMTDINLSGGHPIGWAGTDGQGSWWRTGTLSGTSALVMRQNDGLSWAIFFNSSTYKGISFPGEINREVQTALNQIEQWPEHDLFYYFKTMPHHYPDLAELR